MTVGELRKLLKSYHATTLVVRGDNSGGYENIYQPREEKIANVLSSYKGKDIAVIVE